MLKKNQNIPALIKALKNEYPNPQCALIHANPLQLLVATILSAQCTDERVNMVTPELFKKLKTAKDFMLVDPSLLERLIHSTGFYRNKAKNIKGMGKILVEKYGGDVPRTMQELLVLPGVARKTANVVLGTAFGISDGVVVDTHVLRLSNRLGLSLQKTPEKIEEDLMKNVPKPDWIWISHALITHGRRVCRAVNPNCEACPIKRHCPNPHYKAGGKN